MQGESPLPLNTSSSAFCSSSAVSLAIASASSFVIIEIEADSESCDSRSIADGFIVKGFRVVSTMFATSARWEGLGGIFG